VKVIDPLSTAKVLAELKAFTGESMILMAAAKLKSDFAVYGSITILGSSVSIDAQALDVTGNRPALSFIYKPKRIASMVLTSAVVTPEIRLYPEVKEGLPCNPFMCGDEGKPEWMLPVSQIWKRMHHRS
jgi:hypothetical protein